MKLFVSILALLTVFSFNAEATSSEKKSEGASLVLFSDKADQPSAAQIFEKQMLERRMLEQKNKPTKRRSGTRRGNGRSAKKETKQAPAAASGRGSLPSVASGMFVK